MTEDRFRAPAVDDPDAGGSEVVELWRDPDGLWGWRYRGPQAVLEANRSYSSREEALQSARVAYPGMPIIRLSMRGAGPLGRALKRTALLMILLPFLLAFGTVLVLVSVAVGWKAVGRRIVSVLRGRA